VEETNRRIRNAAIARIAARIEAESDAVDDTGLALMSGAERLGAIKELEIYAGDMESQSGVVDPSDWQPIESDESRYRSACAAAYRALESYLETLRPSD
jgi:hypothetical protein